MKKNDDKYFKKNKWWPPDWTFEFRHRYCIWYIQLVPNTYVSRAKTTDSAYFFTAVKNRQNLFIFLEVTDKAVEV